MLTNRMALWIAAVLLLSSVTAAQIFKGKLSTPKQPTIIYNRVDVKNVTFEKASVDFVFIVDNPNSFGIDNVFADYELFLKDQSAGSGKDMKFKIAASGKSELKMPLDIVYLHVFKSAEGLTKAILGGQKSIPFRLQTKFKIDLKVKKFEIPVTATGEIPLPGIKSAPGTSVLPK
jgi:LEA14-like dessication related protein